MKLNNARPKIEVDPQTYEVFANGDILTGEPAESLSMVQRYLLPKGILNFSEPEATSESSLLAAVILRRCSKFGP